MNDYGQLATTGAAPIIIGGLAIDQVWLVLAGLAVTLAGALLLRYSWRRGRTVTDA